jgi:hypothetical protein
VAGSYTTGAAALNKPPGVAIVTGVGFEPVKQKVAELYANPGSSLGLTVIVTCVAGPVHPDFVSVTQNEVQTDYLPLSDS